MKTHHFVLVLDADEITADLEDRLYEAGCDDALLGVHSGEVYLDFSRAAPSYSQAVSSAVLDAQSAGVRVLRVRAD